MGFRDNTNKMLNSFGIVDDSHPMALANDEFFCIRPQDPRFIPKNITHHARRNGKGLHIVSHPRTELAWVFLHYGVILLNKKKILML